MSGDDLGQAAYLVALLAVLVLGGYRRLNRGGPPTDTPLSDRTGPSSPPSTGFYLFLWLLIVVALFLAVSLLRRQ